jgi:hypothetical protein
MRFLIRSFFKLLKNDSATASFPRAHVCDVGDPGLVRALNGKASLQRIGHQKGNRTVGVPRSSVAVEGFDVIGPHNSSDPMLATGLARFSQIEKDPRGTIDAVAGRISNDDQAEQPLILQCAIG